MDIQILTIISGIVLLIVFGLVGLNMRRRSARSTPERKRSKDTRDI